jgi:hypothetical protein
MSFSSVLARCIVFITIVILWYFGIILIAVPLTIWYLYSYRAYELIILGVAIDAYFLTSVTIPLYTLGFATAVFCMEVLKPRLRNNNLL